MAYNELIKNFECIRSYMREFYVYGFKSRGEYTGKSSRSYDDERRRVESWLGDYMSFHRNADGKRVFISIDSRTSTHNPLYNALKSKSFTDGDITLHFILFDILYSSEIAKSISEITEEIDAEYLSVFNNTKTFDESTIRKKLKEYVEEGLVKTEKKGRTLLYGRADCNELNCTDLLDFYSESAPCGVIGAFLLDKTDKHNVPFVFKHHYITQAFDSEILLSLFLAISNKSEVEITKLNRKSKSKIALNLVPLNIYISVQNGRQYLIAYNRCDKRIMSTRLDFIISVKVLNTANDFDTLRKNLLKMREHMWGVSNQGSGGRIEHVEFTIRCSDNEEYIYNRLVREKRCGTVERLDDNTCRFSADVYDSNEMLPWIRTFIGRIESLNFSNKQLEERFKNDVTELYTLYGLNEDTENDI